MPGMVDVHVHLMDPGDPTRETFPDGSAAAALAGVTTIVEHTHGRPVRTAAELAEKGKYLAGRSYVDFALGAHAWPDLLDEVEGVWRAGAAFIKLFTCATHGVPGLDAALQLDLFRRVAALGAICLVHCENESITASAERRLRSAGRTDGAVVFEWRSREAEQAAIAVTTRLARLTGAEVVVAHVSHGEALGLVTRERAAGARLSAECCPQYLAVLEREVVQELGLRKFTPARTRSQRRRPRADVERARRGRDRLRRVRPRAFDREAEARGVDLGRALRPPGYRHHLRLPARRRSDRPAQLNAMKAGLAGRRTRCRLGMTTRGGLDGVVGGRGSEPQAVGLGGSVG
jgi:dihydroorotase-like cyclic amidohydrolase